MKKAISIVFCLMFALSMKAQERPPVSIINEVTLSVNRTGTVTNSYFSPGWGGGAGIYHLFRKEKQLNILLGLEYNYNSGHHSSIFMSRHSTFQDAFVEIHSASLPLMLRLNFGSSTKVFLEAGGYLEMPIKGKLTGRHYSSFDGYTGVKSSDVKLGHNFGFATSVGVVRPISEKYSVLIKLESRIGQVFTTSSDDTFIYSFFRLTAGFNF